MKKLLVLASLLIASVSMAEVVTVDVPKGHKVVEISSHIWHSGCGSTTNYLDVIKTQDGYVAGYNVAVKHEGDVWINVMPKIIPGPGMVTCMAYVKTTTAVKFTHNAFKAETIDVVVPDSMVRNLEVKVSDVKICSLKIN